MPLPVSRTSRHSATFDAEPSANEIVPGSEASSHTAAFESTESGVPGSFDAVAPATASVPPATTILPLAAWTSASESDEFPPPCFTRSPLNVCADATAAPSGT